MPEPLNPEDIPTLSKTQTRDDQSATRVMSPAEKHGIISTSEGWQIGDIIPHPHTHRGRWEIYDIRRGAMGVVYLVYDLDYKVFFAAKTFQDEVFARSPMLADRFAHEALAWIKLDAHPNVVQARFVEQIKGKPFLFLEYVSGGELRDWIGTPRLTADVPQVLRFGIQLCDGMTHALSKGIKVHRDIKPQNCLVTQDCTLKITDFGLAKVLEFEGGREGLMARLLNRWRHGKADSEPTPDLLHDLTIGMTRSGAAAGTPPYMAPETFTDAKQVDVRADIYSFGVMLYQMITGDLPFIGTHWKEFERLHKFRSPPILRAEFTALNNVVQTCLAKDPTKRFPNFEAVRIPLAEIYESRTGEPALEPMTGPELDASHWTIKGTSLSRLGRRQEAIACYERALKIDPLHASAWIGKGAELGSSEDAIACYERAIEINPRDARAWMNKGTALFGLGEHGRALACFVQAQRMGQPDAADCAAWCRQKLREDRNPAAGGS